MTILLYHIDNGSVWTFWLKVGENSKTTLLEARSTENISNYKREQRFKKWKAKKFENLRIMNWKTTNFENLKNFKRIKNFERLKEA